MILWLFGLLLGTAASPAPAPPSSVRLGTPVFGQRMEIEIPDLPQEAAREAITAALTEAAAIERLADLSHPDGGVARLNAAAGQGPQPADPRLIAILARARDFCFWSEGSYGPLGRDLYQIWGLRAPVAARPSPERLLQATGAAACGHLKVDAAGGRVSLDAGSGLDLWGFAEGQAVDRAAEVLKQRGVRNALVGLGGTGLGGIYRGFGPGPAGNGWPLLLKRAGERIFLRDQSLAIADVSEPSLEIGGEAFPPYLNQRTGQPVQGVLATVAVTELAIDARPLSAALFITGPREGQLRIGSLRPRPSVLWLMGSGASSGASPLRVFYRWSEIAKR